VILETSKGGFHPQKEPVLALLAKGPQMDPYRLLKSPNLFKNKLIDPIMLLKSSIFAQRSSNDQNQRNRRALGRAEIHYREAKMLENHEKPTIASLNRGMNSSLYIWPINDPDLSG